MRKYLLILLLPVLGLFLSACSDSSTSSNPVDTGSLFMTSTPSGATIYIDGTSKGITPDTISGLKVGTINVTLKLDGYSDTTFSVNISKDMMTQPSPIVMKSTLSYVVYGPIRIYETTGTGVSQPSGLVLKTGLTTSLSGADMDLFYYSATGVYELRSADAHSGSTRNTSFYVSSATNLGDGVASPLATNSWLTAVPDNTTNYFFAYDNDMNYSKIKIVAVGGGTVGNPAWMDVEWIYNKVANDKRFPVIAK